jgi:hypothetical protein
MDVTSVLRLFDERGVEIAMVTADPFEWTITHPDESEEWDRLSVSLEGKSTGEEPVHIPDEYIETDAGTFRLHTDAISTHDDTPREHLEWTRDGVMGLYGVASVELADE